MEIANSIDALESAIKLGRANSQVSVAQLNSVFDELQFRCSELRVALLINHEDADGDNSSEVSGNEVMMHFHLNPFNYEGIYEAARAGAKEALELLSSAPPIPIEGGVVKREPLSDPKMEKLVASWERWILDFQ